MYTSTVNHPKYGEIVYSESTFWAIPSISVNGVKLEKKKRRKFLFKGEGEETVFSIRGAFGIYLEINGEKIELKEKLKWYEVLSGILVAAFMIIWSNVPALYEIIPILGGAVGGAIAGVVMYFDWVVIRKVKNKYLKVLVPFAFLIAGFLASFLLILLSLPFLFLIFNL